MMENQAQKPEETTIYVGDIPRSVTANSLYNVVGKYGEIQNSSFYSESRKDKRLGFAFYTFKSAASAQEAVKALNNMQFKGKAIRVMMYTEDPSCLKSDEANVYVSNLDKGITQKELYDTVSQFGEVISCKSGRSRGHAFIHFANKEIAESCIEAMSGMIWNDRIIYAGPCIPKGKRGNNVPTSLYVGNFASDMTNEGLRSLFDKFGEISNVCVVRNKNGESRQFGFVTFTESADAVKALHVMNGRELEGGRRICVNYFQRKEKRAKMRTRN